MNPAYRKITKFYLKTSRLLSNNLEKLKMTEHIYMIVLASIIGILAGFVGIGMKEMIHFVSDLSFSGHGNFLENVISTPWYLVLIIPTIGGLLVGGFVNLTAKEAKGHGVPEVMQSILIRGGKIKPKIGIVKAIASAITIGTGGSVGKEGPIIQIGASLGSSIGQFLRVPTSRLKVLVGCGAAAGIAGVFNAPIAGAIFAVEIILMDFAISSFSPIVISSVMATVITHLFLGDFAEFTVINFQMVSPYESIFYIFLGIFTGLVSFSFIKVLYFFENLWDNIIKMPAFLKAGFGGLSIGIIALLFPEVMGSGYESINSAINYINLDYNGLQFFEGFDFINTFWLMAATLIFVKILATSLTLGSGGSGGVFAPSLFMGAMAGATFGYLVNYLFPGYTANPGAYALVAMGGVVAGTTRAPITAIIIVFELTKENAIILPLMLTCTVSLILSSKLSRESIYTLKLLEKNIKVKNNAEMNIMRSLFVSDTYTKNFLSVYESRNFADLVSTLISHRMPFISVKNKKDEFVGTVSINDIKDFLFDKEELKFVLIAGDIANKDIPKVTLEDNCKDVMEIMNLKGYEGLPVVESKNSNKQIGIIWKKDINDTYHKELERIELTSNLATQIARSNAKNEVQFMEGYIITEIPAADIFIGKSIADLRIRSNYGVDILSIKKADGQNKNTIKAIPDADYIIQKDDILIVAGESEKVNKLKIII